MGAQDDWQENKNREKTEKQSQSWTHVWQTVCLHSSVSLCHCLSVCILIFIYLCVYICQSVCCSVDELGFLTTWTCCHLLSDCWGSILEKNWHDRKHLVQIVVKRSYDQQFDLRLKSALTPELDNNSVLSYRVLEESQMLLLCKIRISSKLDLKINQIHFTRDENTTGEHVTLSMYVSFCAH